MEDKKEKKQRVIHTRVSETMDQELKERAANLGLSVSNLVRNVLQNTFGLVEDIVSDTASVARSARGEAKTVAPAPSGEVIGWQPLLLNVNAVCAKCNALLPKGSQGAVGVTAIATDPRQFICGKCLEELSNDTNDE